MITEDNHPIFFSTKDTSPHFSYHTTHTHTQKKKKSNEKKKKEKVTLSPIRREISNTTPFLSRSQPLVWVTLLIRGIPLPV